MCKMKIGILGNSSIARRCIVPAIKQIKDLELVGIGSRNTDFGYDELLSSDADIIYVSLPPALHFEWGKKVLLSGKHLLMEKTFTTNTAEAIELFSIAKQKNLKCMKALMYEFHPVQDKIDNLLKEIGDVKYIDASFCFPHFKSKSNIRYSKELGGGSIYDSLIYPLSFVNRILGKNIENHTFAFFEKDVVERGSICLKYKDSIANINFGFGQAYRNEITISGHEKTIKAKRVFTRTHNCIDTVDIVHNGNVTKIEIQKSDHFENMIRFFISSNTKDLCEKELNTLSRLKFIDKII